jgi:hypothetical protein
MIVLTTHLKKMIPYGKNKKMRRNLPDNHPKKGYVNWWEVELGGVDKGRERQRAKVDIRKEIDGQSN